MLSAIDPRRALVLVAAISLLAPIVPTADDRAGAQIIPGDCDFSEDPLWITSVETIADPDPSTETIVTEEEAVFTETGASLAFELEIENRVSTECDYTEDRSNDLNVQVQYLHASEEASVNDEPPSQESSGQEASSPEDLDCGGTTAGRDSIQPGDVCETEVSLPGNEVTGDSGEQRVRFLIWDDDAGEEMGNLNDCTDFACTAGERVIVVDKRPDLVVESLGLETDEPKTTYVPQDTSFSLTIGNDGDYPNWNPNGARSDSNFGERSSYDGDDNNQPDERSGSETTYDYQDADATVPSCQWLQRWDGAAADYGCSYRYGAPIQTPIRHEIRHESGGETIETGASNTYGSTRTDGSYDKDSSDVIQNGTTFDVTFDALDREKRAGQFFVTAIVDEDEDGEGFNPEQNEDNNDESETIDILGVDLRLTGHNLFVDAATGATDCPESDPCPVDADIKINPEFENAGDRAADCDNENPCETDLRDIPWTAAVYKNGERVLTKSYESDSGSPDPIPKTTDGEEEFWLTERTIDPNSEGGRHTIVVRLDHPDNYDESVHDDRGEVGERGEDQTCPESIDSADNAWCIDLYFEDQNPPNIEEVSIDGTGTEGGVPQVQEGENATFEAEIVNTQDEADESLETVTAFFETENGTEANLTGPDGEKIDELELTRSETDGRFWSSNTTIHGEPDRYVYKVQAEDLNHTVTSQGLTFDLTGLPTNIEVDPPGGGGFTVNGQSDFGSDPPRYEGTAEDPTNTFNITASINGTGHDSSADVADNTSVQVVRPNGETVAWSDVAVTERCLVEGQLSGDQDYRSGSECEDARDSSAETVVDSWDWYYVNSTAQGIDLDWAGWFDVIYHVSDAFGRNTTFDRSALIADRLNDNGEEAPMLENATVTPTSVDPGATVTASVEASDSLRVENVTLAITKPGGSTLDAPLQVDELDNQNTLNGTYTETFNVGPQAPYFDQGGTYDVRLAAEDFAENTNEAQEISLAVNDTDHPTIVDFTTVPNGTQEVGGPITWVAEIEDQTAVQPPELRINRPTSGPTGALEMEYNETEDRWKLEMDASEVDVGTWTYDLTVADYTGKQSTASGEIQVEENLAPQAENWAPAVSGPGNGTYGPAEPTISVDVVDYGQGVNQSSIAFSVDGEDRTDDAEITRIDECDPCYRIQYTPTEAFAAGSTVDVTLEAADTSDPPLESDTLRHQFQVDAEAPTADIELGPAVTQGEQRVIGLPTDIDVSVTDGGSGPGSTDVTVTDADGASQTITLAGGEGTLRLQEFDEVADAHGSYQLSVQAEDAVGNTADPVQQPVLFDQLGPSIEVFAEPGKPREVVFANVTDDAEIQTVEAHYSVDDGAEQTLELQEEEGTWSVRLYNQRTDDAFQEGSTVHFTVEATDVFGNVRSSPENNFTAGDSVPTVSFLTPEEGATISDTSEISWSADDAETPTDELRISLFYKKPGDTFQEVPEAQDIPNRGSYRLDTTGLPNGDVTLQVFVLDGQNFAADEVNVTVRNLGDTFSAPELQDARTEDGRSVLAPSQETVFRVQIDGDVRRAWANITTESGDIVETVDLESRGGSTWQGSFVGPSERGNYSVSLSAVTAEGVEEAGSAYGFSVQGDEIEGDNFIPEWTLLTALTATAVALGALGLRSRWT